MILRLSKYRKKKNSWELEKIKHPARPREDSSFHTKDKDDYSSLIADMSGTKSKNVK